MPKLSILLPTYNGARYLDEQVESILAQTDPDFELLAIDDGSTDDTREQLARLARTDDRITVLPTVGAGNRGQNARLVELLAQARGEYVAFADQDDRWAPDRNQRLFAALGDHTMVFGRSELTDATGVTRGVSLLDTFNLQPRTEDRLLAFIQPMFSAHAMIMRREAIAAPAFFNTLPFDWLLALEALLLDGYAYCDEAVVFHRQHDNNQLNNFHNFELSETLTTSDLRYVLLFRQPSRLRMWSTLDFLGRSPSVGREWRKAMLGLAGACYVAWFSEWRALKPGQPKLRRQLIDTLAPLAGSSIDLERFERHVAVLTGPALGQAMRREAGRRWRQIRSRSA